jgi:hypothetical protein
VLELRRCGEPMLEFAHGQLMEDPRDGLSLFGPLEAGRPYGVQAGVIGTTDGIRRYRAWVDKVQHPVGPGGVTRPLFPGFEAAFGGPWGQPVLEVTVDGSELRQLVRISDPHQRVYAAVGIYADGIVKALREEEPSIGVWFVVIPDEVHRYCRPESLVARSEQIAPEARLPVRFARSQRTTPSLFVEDNERAVAYQHEVDFHHQLKARLLAHSVPTQVIRESTIAHREILAASGRPTRDLDAIQADIAWSLSTAAFYKTGGRPWKLGAVRRGVCYVGLVFKRDNRMADARSACCAAQMFLDSGDGIVFRGAVGPWHNPKRGDYHLNAGAARQLVELAVRSYADKTGAPPAEMFLHGRVRFEDEEWEGFASGVPSSTNLVGVRIRQTSELKLYRQGEHPVLRGLYHVQDDRLAYLWTKGFTPRLQTYPGREVPNPLLVDVCRGEADLDIVVRDIMGLTKLNYNSCIFADGQPVTLRFADAIGEILTAAPIEGSAPLPFKYYI